MGIQLLWKWKDATLLLPSKERLQSHQNLAEKYHQALSQEAKDYLASRGFSARIAADFLLGTVPPDCDSSHAQYVGWISIPYRVIHGVAAWKFRRLDDLGVKYMAPAHQPSRLFNARAVLDQSDTIAICEGELDTIVACQVIPAVGIAGVNHWKEHFGRLFVGHRRVLIIGDNDIKKDGSNPGQEFARRVAEDVPHAEVIVLPPNEDVNSLALKEGLTGLRRRLGVDEH
jgi:DNA primase